MKVSKEKIQFSWSDPKFRAWVYQAAILIILIWGAWYLITNTLNNLAASNIRTGFSFLNQEAGFAIGESLIPFSVTDTYARAVWVGILNTIMVSTIGIILATIIGTIVGIARLSKNWIANRLAAVYVEVMRNIPLLVHLFFWYTLLTEALPGPRQALNPVDGVFLSNRGIKFPSLEGSSVLWVVLAVVFALLAGLLVFKWARRKQRLSGKTTPVLWLNLLLLISFPLLALLLSGGDLQLNKPELRGFNFVNGITLTPEMLALIIGLVLYTAAFVAEIVRSGIRSIGNGQWEAGRSLGLSNHRILFLIIIPQALRVMVPPMSNTFMNLTKNSSLAVAIGYPDIVSIVNTMLTQTGQAIEAVAIIMAAYLTISLSIALVMNLYNRRIALVER